MAGMMFGERLRAIREGRLVRSGPPIGLRELARCTGISNTTLSHAETGKGWVGKLPSIEDLEALARCLEVTIPQLVGRPIEGLPGGDLDEAAPPAESLADILRRIGAIPIFQRPTELEQVGSAGRGRGVIQGLEDERPRRRRSQPEPERYLLRVEGDCLAPDVKPGDHVEFEPDGPYQPGDLVVALMDGEKVLVKHFDEVDQVQYLLPLNGDPLPIGENMRIIGVVVDIHRRPSRHRMGRR